MTLSSSSGLEQMIIFSTDPDTSLSVNGNVTSIGVESKQGKEITGSLLRIANSSISWCSKTQDVVTLSTHESDFCSAAHSVQGGIAHN